MQILISCAKTMTDRSRIELPESYEPYYNQQAGALALELMQYPATELGKMLRVNSKIAAENKRRYQQFHDETTPALPAIAAYTGIVFKHIGPDSFTPDDFRYAQRHLFITSFLYGLLRPSERIKNYRLEGDVTLPSAEGKNMFDYWKPLLTDRLIAAVKADDGILVNLASDEMKGLFEWEKVCREVRVTTPTFKVWKGDELKTIVVYTKMCRGHMTRFLLKQRITQPDELKAFEWEGFRFDGKRSSEQELLFSLG